MIRTFVVAGLVGVPLGFALMAASPASAVPGEVSCSNPCNIVQQTNTNYRNLPALAIHLYTGPCDEGTELSCGPEQFTTQLESIPTTAVNNYAALPGKAAAALDQATQIPSYAATNYASLPGIAANNYANLPGAIASNLAALGGTPDGGSTTTTGGGAGGA